MTASRGVVLVTDGEHRASLAVVRSLGLHGYHVIVAASARHSLAGGSRYARSVVRVPDPLTAPVEFGQAIGEAAMRWNVSLVLPITDAAIRALLPIRDALPAPIPFGPADTVFRAADKPEVLRIAHTLGIHVPRQALLVNPSDLADAELRELSWPLVVKPGSSVREGADGPVKLGVSWARDAEELRYVLERLSTSAFPLLLQERIQGPGIGIFLLRWNGRTLAVFAHERIREKPPSGGVSVCCMSVPPQPKLVAQAEALLDALDWQGPAMVEFKRDARTGDAYLMEVNGRFWGSLQLAIDAGVDFPRLLVEAALGHPAETVCTGRAGVRLRWWWGEVDHLISCLRHPADARLSAGSRWRVARNFLMPGWATRNEVLRWNDPMPAVWESLEWLRALTGPPR